MLLQDITGQGVYLYAEIISSSLPKTGDSANITGAHSLDGAAEVSGFATVHPTEIGGGVYWQPLSQGETDGKFYGYRWASSTSGVLIRPMIGVTAGVQLADGVAHGGTPGSSTSTLALQKINVTDPNDGEIAVTIAETGSFGMAMSIDSMGTGNIGVRIQSDGTSLFLQNHDSVTAPVVISGTESTVSLAGPNAAAYLQGGSSSPAVLMYGPYTTPGPVVVLDGTESGAGVDGGPGIEIRVGGAGQQAVMLRPAVATDSLAIAAGDGDPIDVFNADGSVNTPGGGSMSAPIAITAHVRQALSQAMGSKAVADAFVRSLEGG